MGPHQTGKKAAQTREALLTPTMQWVLLAGVAVLIIVAVFVFGIGEGSGVPTRGGGGHGLGIPVDLS